MDGEFDFANALSQPADYPQLFTLVKQGVESVLGGRRAGLMLGLTDLGASPAGIIGAYYPVDSNLIVLNKTAVKLFGENHPKLMNAFIFNLLLHEYLHSLGMHDENDTRKTTHYICSQLFGPSHPATDIAAQPHKYLQSLMWEVPKDPTGMVELVHGFDAESLSSYS